MSVIQVGLIDTTGKLDPKLVEATAAALNVQVIRDLPQYWSVRASGADGKVRSLRVFVDGKTYSEVRKHRKHNAALAERLKAHRDLIEHATERRGRRVREEYLAGTH